LIKDRSGFIELATQKTGIYFTTPNLKEISDKYDDMSRLYLTKQASLVKDVIDVVASFSASVQQFNEIIAR
jgi:DNA mismatch repair protein MSH2